MNLRSSGKYYLYKDMKKESEVCQSCPVMEVCNSNLTPEHAEGRRLVTNNPWNCKHLTCPAGVVNAKAEIKRMKANKEFFGYAYFQSKDKPSVRRVLMKTRIIESKQNGEWYSVGQSLDKTYTVKSEDFPFKRIRNLSALK
jgi:hypothetical protein